QLFGHNHFVDNAGFQVRFVASGAAVFHFDLFFLRQLEQAGPHIIPVRQLLAPKRTLQNLVQHAQVGVVLPHLPSPHVVIVVFHVAFASGVQALGGTAQKAGGRNISSASYNAQEAVKQITKTAKGLLVLLKGCILIQQQHVVDRLQQLGQRKT